MNEQLIEDALEDAGQALGRVMPALVACLVRNDLAGANDLLKDLHDRAPTNAAAFLRGIGVGLNLGA